MVLVDTSVWIRALGGGAPYLAELDRLLARDEVACHELVYGELLIGNRGGRKKLLADYERMYHVPAIAHSEVVEFVRGRGLHGRGVGWIDIHLLASALVTGSQLWTADPRFAGMATELGIAYNPARPKTLLLCPPGTPRST
jgi:predicted nucleic acid-binding protein